MPSSNVRWAPPLIRLPPWFPGQMGVPGTGNDTGLRVDSNANILYVDPNFPGASDQRYGTEPNAPLLTVAAALTKCSNHTNDVIVVAPNSNWVYGDTSVGRATPIAEEVTVSVAGVRIIGLAPPSSVGVYWKPITDSGVCITVHALDVLIEGFGFWNDEFTTPVAIKAEWDGTDTFGDNMTVRNCYFESGFDYGIQLDFAYNCDIHNNYFEDIDTAAIYNLDVGGDPDYATIHDNTFNFCTVAIGLEDSNLCTIFNNRISGNPAGVNNFIDLTGGGNNFVSGNFLGCTIAQFDTTCSDATSGAWVQNYCIDGPTVAPPT